MYKAMLIIALFSFGCAEEVPPEQKTATVVLVEKSTWHSGARTVLEFQDGSRRSIAGAWGAKDDTFTVWVTKQRIYLSKP